jgi:hypothetical protein
VTALSTTLPFFALVALLVAARTELSPAS